MPKASLLRQQKALSQLLCIIIWIKIIYSVLILSTPKHDLFFKSMSTVCAAATQIASRAMKTSSSSSGCSSSSSSSFSPSFSSRGGRNSFLKTATQKSSSSAILPMRRRKKISVRTNAVLFLPPVPGGAGAAMIGAIDADRIAEVYDFSSSTNQIEVQRVFEVADAASAEMTLEQAPAVDATNKPPEKEKKSALQKGGWLGPITNALESTLEGIDGILAPVAGTNSYGFSILALTLLVKLVTFPLTKKQIEGSVNMQALQPKVKELQAMYANDPERLQMETARLYKEANFNPLAGCLPTFATLPVFIGLYRALSNASVEGLLQDGFYWIPSLGGPATIEMRNDGAGFSWLFPLVDGAPPIGWHDALSYLVLPVLLVISQSVSQKIMQPESAKSADPAQQQSQAILKFLPLMIGYFSLNVPAGLTLYWFFNNIVTTAQTVYLRKTTKPIVNVGGATAAGDGGGASSQPVRVDYVPKRERRSGATIPKAAAPKVDVSNAISAEFTDFDEGPAKVKSAVESEFGDFEDGPAKVQEDGEDSSRGNRRGSRKKRRGGSR